MAFKKGASGNKKGRPPGRPDKRIELRELLRPHAPALLKKAVSMALEGDPGALRLCIDRLVPSVKATSEPVKLELPKGATLSEQAQAVMDAATSGELTTDEAAGLMAVLQGQLRIKEQDEIERRLLALEQSQGGKS